ncbi:MAG: hypothetical protein PGN12_01575 [Sphingomonas phyllosphaerae]
MLDQLPALIDAGLSALSSNRSDIGMTFERRRREVRIKIGGMDFRFCGDTSSDLLAWERLADRIPAVVERARLQALQRAAGEDQPEAWSVHTSATTLAWMTWASGGNDTSAWHAAMGTILAAAERNSDVAITPKSGGRPIVGVLRSRRLLAMIPVAAGIDYMDSQSVFLAREQIPQAASIHGPGCDVTAIVGASWLTGKRVTIKTVHVDQAGTLVRVRQPLFPLAPIPRDALQFARSGGPAYAPWMITRAERTAFDAVDATAHEVV